MEVRLITKKYLLLPEDNLYGESWFDTFFSAHMEGIALVEISI